MNEISPGCPQGEILPTNLSDSGPTPSFSAKIDKLRAENARLEEELNQWRDQTSTEYGWRQRAPVTCGCPIKVGHIVNRTSHFTAQTR